MTATAQRPRTKASLLTAAGFAVFLALLVVVGISIPPVGMLVYATLLMASPFAWGWSLFAGSDAPWPIARAYLPLAFAAPFPLLGLLVGLVWPFHLESPKQVLNAIGMRFALTLGGMLVIGVGLFVLAPKR